MTGGWKVHEKAGLIFMGRLEAVDLIFMGRLEAGKFMGRLD